MKIKIAKNQPQWVCWFCGEQYGLYYQLELKEVLSREQKRCSTYHEGVCGVCLETKTVTEPRDYGYLLPGWELTSLVSQIANY